MPKLELIRTDWNSPELTRDSDFYWLGNGLFRDHWGLGLGSENFKVAAFLQTGAHGSDLALLFHDERGAALGARFGDGHVRSCEITIGIARAAVKHAWAAASAFSGATAANEFAFV